MQGSKLVYHWQQIDGPAVKISAEGPVLHFTAPRRNLQQAAWVALARGLIRHPDFVFTRPPSMEFARNPEEKRRLKLVKLHRVPVNRQINLVRAQLCPPAEVSRDGILGVKLRAVQWKIQGGLMPVGPY